MSIRKKMPTLTVPSGTPLGTLSISQGPGPPAEFVIKYRVRMRQVTEMSTDRSRTFSAPVFTQNPERSPGLQGGTEVSHLRVQTLKAEHLPGILSVMLSGMSEQSHLLWTPSMI